MILRAGAALGAAGVPCETPSRTPGTNLVTRVVLVVSRFARGTWTRGVRTLMPGFTLGCKIKTFFFPLIKHFQNYGYHHVSEKVPLQEIEVSFFCTGMWNRGFSLVFNYNAKPEYLHPFLRINSFYVSYLGYLVDYLILIYKRVSYLWFSYVFSSSTAVKGYYTMNQHSLIESLWGMGWWYPYSWDCVWLYHGIDFLLYHGDS